MSSRGQVVVGGSGGIGFLGALAILFITLKLCGVISWPWILVLLPLWIMPALIFTVFMGIFVIVLLVQMYKRIRYGKSSSSRRKKYDR